MLENLSETSEDTNIFYPTDVEDSKLEQPETEEGEEDSEIEEDPEELADDDTEDDEEDEDETESLDVFGVEMTREDFETMKNQQLMHADYTKKGQALALDKKETLALNSALSDAISEFESLTVNEENDEELKELKEDDYVEYLRRKELIDARKSKLKGFKTLKEETKKSIQAEENKTLFSIKTEWDDTPKGQAKYKSDSEAAYKYAAEIGFTNEDLNNLEDHKVLLALIDAGIARQSKTAKPANAKRKTLASKKISGKKVVQAKELSTAELFYGK